MLKTPTPGICLLLLALASSIQLSAQDRGRIIDRNGVSVSPGTRHPTPENIPEACPPDLALRESRNASERVFLGGIDADSVVLGVLEGKHHEMFGYIADVATDGLETLYVLDSEYNEVRVFDYSGNFLGSFGSPGRGPGEFRSPQEIAVSGRTVFVVEYLQVHVFERQESGFLLTDSFKKDFMGFRGNCAMNGHLYTVGYSPEEEHVVHKLTVDGISEASFAEPYSSANTAVQTVISSDGLLACSEKHRIVGVIMDNVPTLTAYTEDGVVAWRTRLTDFRPRVMEELIDEGRAAILQGREGYLHTLFSDGADHFYLGYYTAGYDEDDYANHIFRIDVRTGKGEHLGTGNVAAVNGGSIFVASHHPYPRIIIYKRKDAD